MNRRGFASTLIVLIVLAVLVAGGVWYFGTHQSSSSYQIPTIRTATTTQLISEATTSNTQAINSETSSTSSVGNSTDWNYVPYFKLQSLVADATTTADWLTYTDPMYGFSFNYPKELAVCVVSSSNFTYQESIEEIGLTATSDGGCSSSNELGNPILIHVATPQSIAVQHQQSMANGQIEGESEYFTPFACENNMTVSCGLYTWFGLSDPTKIYVFNGMTNGRKLRIEFDADLGGYQDDAALSKALSVYQNSSGSLSISDSQFINLAQANGEPGDAAFIEILNSIYSSFGP